MLLHGLLIENIKTIRDDTQKSEASNSSSVLYIKGKSIQKNVQLSHKKHKVLHKKVIK